MEPGNDVEAGQFSTERFPIVMRGYERTAVDEAMREEQERHNDLQQRMLALQCELAALSTAGGVPSRKRVLRRVLDLLADGWDEAVRVTAETEYAMGCARARAEGVAAANLALTERQCAAAEQGAQEAADRLVAAAHEEAARILAEATARHAQAQAAATELTRIASERAEEVTAEFDQAFRTLAAEAETELKERQSKAEFDLETAQAQIATARSDAEAILERAATHREAMLEGARTQVAAIEASSDTEVLRLQEETDRSVAALADLMLSAGGKLTGFNPPTLTAVPKETPTNSPKNGRDAPAA